MERETLSVLVGRKLTIRQIAAEVGTSFTNVRYWLRKHGLATALGPRGRKRDEQHPRRCKCGENDPSAFYGNKRYICARCQNRQVHAKGVANRKRILTHLGGRCRLCGFDRYHSALDVHHINPAEKDPAFTHVRGWSWARIERELRLCVLLCRNCHAAVHCGEATLALGDRDAA